MTFWVDNRNHNHNHNYSTVRKIDRSLNKRVYVWPITRTLHSPAGRTLPNGSANSVPARHVRWALPRRPLCPLIFGMPRFAFVCPGALSSYPDGVPVHTRSGRCRRRRGNKRMRVCVFCCAFVCGCCVSGVVCCRRCRRLCSYPSEL